MTREDLIRILVDKHDALNYKNMTVAVKHLVGRIADALHNGERIEIRGFGSFALRYRAPRTARNPKTGVQLQTLEKFAVHFRPGKELREKVNDGFAANI